MACGNGARCPLHRRPDLQSVTGRGWLLAPVGALYGALMLLPLGIILRFSLSDSGGHFSAVLHSRLLLRAAENTITISLITTAIALVLGYLLAAALWRASPAWRRLLLAVVLLPFWTAVLIKNFAWSSLLQDNGAINSSLIALGLVDAPVTLLHNRFAVIVGMVHYVLPYAVFPIHNAMQAIDRRVERAARSLGATAVGVLWRITLPLTMPGVISAALLVFIVSSGFFITPVILGAPSDMMVANLVDYYVHLSVNFGNAAALSMLILIAVLPLVLVRQMLSSEALHGPA
jgi:ABC-type spermidine/putrescine transport system permease subunit I